MEIDFSERSSNALPAVSASKTIDLMEREGEKKRRRLDRSELYSFLLVASTMALYGVILEPSYYLLFFGLAVLDGYFTYFRLDRLVSIDRVVFGFLAILLSAIVANLGVLPLMVEVVFMIALLDFSGLLRKIHHSDEQVRIIRARVHSYLISLVPALVFSFAMVYVYSAVATVPQDPILLLGLASAGIFVLIFVVARIMLSTSSSPRSRNEK